MAVIGADGETLGRVDAVMRVRSTGMLQLVVQAADGERVVLPLEQMDLVDRQLHLKRPAPARRQVAPPDPQDLAPVDKHTELARLAEQRPAG